MQPKASGEFLDNLARRLGYRHAITKSSDNLGGGFSLFLNYIAFEGSNRVVAIEFLNAQSNISKWLLISLC